MKVMDVKEIQTQKALSQTQMTLAEYSVNPYKGCEFDCSYCYAKCTKNFDNNTLFVKTNIAQQLEKELSIKKVNSVVLGSNCECFTYADEKFKLSEKILQTLNKYKVTYTILTKSPFIARYSSLINQNKKNRVFFTYNVADDNTKNLLESSSTSLAKRKQALLKLVENKVSLRVHIGPFIPYVCSVEPIINIFKEKIKEYNVELYHKDMGNFDIVKERIKNLFPEIEQIENIYKNKTNYENFSRELKNQVLSLEKKNHVKIHLIIPQFLDYYNSTIVYD